MQNLFKTGSVKLHGDLKPSPMFKIMVIGSIVMSLLLIAVTIWYVIKSTHQYRDSHVNVYRVESRRVLFFMFGSIFVLVPCIYVALSWYSPKKAKQILENELKAAGKLSWSSVKYQSFTFEVPLTFPNPDAYSVEWSISRLDDSPRSYLAKCRVGPEDWLFRWRKSFEGEIVVKPKEEELKHMEKSSKVQREDRPPNKWEQTPDGVVIEGEGMKVIKSGNGLFLDFGPCRIGVLGGGMAIEPSDKWTAVTSARDMDSFLGDITLFEGDWKDVFSKFYFQLDEPTAETFGRTVRERFPEVHSRLPALIEFESMFDLDDRSFQCVLREMVVRQLTQALKGATPEVLAKFQKNMSARAFSMMKEDIDWIGDYPDQTAQARREIARTLHRLVQEGEIVISTKHA